MTKKTDKSKLQRTLRDLMTEYFRKSKYLPNPGLNEVLFWESTAIEDLSVEQLHDAIECSIRVLDEQEKAAEIYAEMVAVREARLAVKPWWKVFG